MRRYYFDQVEAGCHTPDRSGIDCGSESEARLVAKQKARCHIRRSIRRGSLPLNAFVVIRLACGERLGFIPYADADAA